MKQPPPRQWRRPRLQAGSTAAAAFIANVRAAVAQIRANARGAADGSDPEHLHQLRVGIRRLRSTLRAFRGLVRRQRSQRFDHELRAMLRSMGAVRDWDAFLQSGVSATLRQAAVRDRARAQHSMRNVVTPQGLNSLMRRLLAWAGSKPWRKSADPEQALGEFGARALRRLFDAVREAAAGIDWADAERRHRVRIRVKRLRYGCDCFIAGFPPEAMDAFQHRLKRLQEVLGELNDIAVQRRLLKALACATGTPLSRLAARERALLKTLEEAWRKFDAHPPHGRQEAARARA